VLQAALTRAVCLQVNPADVCDLLLAEFVLLRFACGARSRYDGAFAANLSRSLLAQLVRCVPWARRREAPRCTGASGSGRLPS
jgi:hypothetical protein